MALRPKGKGFLVRGCEFPTPIASQELNPPHLGDLWCYISFSLVHPPPTLVSHPCSYLSARPIGHSFWRSVSCCGPDRTIQGSHPHKWGHGVSCGYLIWRWQLLLKLLFYHAPMAGPLGSELPLALSPSMILVCWGQGRPRQYILAVWIPFVRLQAFLPPRYGPWTWYEMGWSP